ncbi:MAG TPA: DnaA regulatory inactivator Hda [Steroidobacteraceae bacterium]|nr:DnaA regulatory inactivator Hda [Steroidobacteraceae bacterium]
MQQLPLGVRLADRAVFASFHPGDNQQALQWLRGFASPGGAGVGVLHGPAGSGKSHLLQAVCAQLPGSGYFPLTELLRLGPGSLEGAETLSCVCIDDLQLAAGDPAWEAALFRLYCEIEARHGRLLLAAPLPPALPGLRTSLQLPDLASRLAAAVSFGLRPLDEAQQREALRLRAQQRGLELPEEVALYLQRRFPRDMGSLHRLLDTLDLASLAEQRRLTLPFIREVLGSHLPPDE